MKKQLIVELFRNKKKEICFRVKSKNGKIIAQSGPESYKSKQNAMKTVKVLQGLNIWTIKDLLE